MSTVNAPQSLNLRGPTRRSVVVFGYKSESSTVDCRARAHLAGAANGSSATSIITKSHGFTPKDLSSMFRAGEMSLSLGAEIKCCGSDHFDSGYTQATLPLSRPTLCLLQFAPSSWKIKASQNCKFRSPPARDARNAPILASLYGRA